MSTTLATDEPPRQPEPEARGTSWRKILFWSLLGVPILFLVLIPFIGFSPFILLFIVVPAIAAFFARRPGKGGVILGLVIAVLLIAMNGPFFVFPAFAQPASTGDFISAAIFLVLCVLAIIAAIAILRRGDRATPAARTSVRVGVSVVLLAIVVAVIGRVTYESDDPEQGDIRLVTENIEFATEQIESDGGTVAVFVENRDQTLHTFTIDDLDVNLQVPANGNERIAFEAPAGEYEFYCVPHESVMKGTLTVR